MSEPDPIPIQEVSTLEGYAHWASSYDERTNALILLEEIHVGPLLAQLPFTKALDVGSGTGRYALKLARRGAQVTALDQSSEMLAVARRAAQQEGLSIDFRLASLDEGLPLEANQFDLVVCALMLCHVPNLSHAMQEFARVLRPGGHLLITDFHPDSVSYGWRTGFRNEGVVYQLPNMPHTRNDYVEALKSSGLKLLQAIDLPLGALPERDYPPPLTREFIEFHGKRHFCLILVGQKME